MSESSANVNLQCGLCVKFKLDMLVQSSTLVGHCQLIAVLLFAFCARYVV